MTDESIVNLSDTTKATMRNYAMVAGFMIIFIYAAILASIFFSGKTSSEVLGASNYVFFRFLIGISMMIIGAALAFLHKRDLVAITFILFAIMVIVTPILHLMYGGEHAHPRLPVMITLLIIGVAMLFTRNEQKYICGLILLPFAFLSLIYGLNHNFNINAIGFTILAIVSLFSALCIGLENPKFPGYRLLTVDEIDVSQDGSPVHFKVSGSILGFALIMIPSICFILGYFNIGNVGPNATMACEIGCGLMLVFVGFLMLTAGRMKFTPFMFVIVGIIMSLRPIGAAYWLTTLFFLVIGLICLLRSDRRILVGISIILLGLTSLFGASSAYPSTTVIATLCIVIVAIQSYICFALCSDNRLKLI